ncbi:heavy metal-associated domain-containing protein [Ferrimicrobium sp.]|nr:heavy metal-associated domain-containing protein [Ferrimicrobium sp.]
MTKLPNVRSVVVDLDDKIVTVEGDGLDVGELLSAIDEAGYDAELIS